MNSTYRSLFRGAFLLGGLVVLGLYLKMVIQPSSNEMKVQAVETACPDTGLPEPMCPKHGNPVLADEPSHPILDTTVM